MLVYGFQDAFSIFYFGVYLVAYATNIEFVEKINKLILNVLLIKKFEK
jgi:hypothetical protein